MPTKGRSFLKRKLRREGRRSDYLRGGVSDGALRSLQPQPDYSSGGGNTSTSSPCVPRTYEYRSRKRWRWNRRAIHAGRRYTPCGKPNRPVRMGSFFVKPSEAPLSRQTPSFAVACLLRKTISTPLAQGNGFTHGAITPAFLRGVGAASHLPCRSFAAAYRIPLKVILFLKAKTLYAITQKNIKIFFIFFGADAIVKR